MSVAEGPQPQWRVQARADLVAGLQEAYRKARRPPLREIGPSCNCSPSTLSRAFNGRVVPRPSVVRALLKDLLRRGGLDEATADRLWVLHTRILEGLPPGRDDAAALPGLGSPRLVDPASLHACELCGAAVADRRRHLDWHRGANGPARS